MLMEKSTNGRPYKKIHESDKLTDLLVFATRHHNTDIIIRLDNSGFVVYGDMHEDSFYELGVIADF